MVLVFGQRIAISIAMATAHFVVLFFAQCLPPYQISSKLEEKHTLLKRVWLVGRSSISLTIPVAPSSHDLEHVRVFLENGNIFSESA